MITISDVAAEKAKEILAAEGKPDWGLRIYTAGGGCSGPSYGMDIDEQPTEDDEIFEKNGLRVFIDKVTSAELIGLEIGYADDGERKGFVLAGSPPESASGCSACSGC